MSEYLSPCNKEITIDEKRKKFAVRNKMVNLKENFTKSKLPENCVCGEIESLEHIYSCKELNNEENRIPFEEIYSNNIKNQIEVLRNTEKSLKNRKIVK